MFEYSMPHLSVPAPNGVQRSQGSSSMELQSVCGGDTERPFQTADSQRTLRVGS